MQDAIKVTSHQCGAAGDENNHIVITGSNFSDASGEPLDFEIYRPGVPVIDLPFCGLHGETSEDGQEIFGITNEALLAVVMVRLKSMSRHGTMATDEIDDAVDHIEDALRLLQQRTMDRSQRTVIGTDIP